MEIARPGATADEHAAAPVPFSASADRVRAARAYVLWVKPALLVVVSLLTLASWFVEPSDVPMGLWLINLAFWTFQALWIMLVRLGVDPLPVAGASFAMDGVFEFAAMFSSPEPVGTSSSMTFFVVAASYFLPAAATVAYAIACGIGITVAAQLIDDWGEAYFIPSTAVLVLITGAVCAFVMSRVRRTEDRLARSITEQVAARERLELVDRARDRLIANVSHELRTPLTSTIGSIETMLREDLVLTDEQRARLMRVARDGGLRLLVLVEDLLTLGATRPDSLDLATEPEHLGDIARDAIEGIDPGADRSLYVDVRQDPLVRIDRMRMLQVVGNLAVNAVRHGRGPVVVETAVSEGRATIRVLDDGDGVASEHLDELFMPFARFSTRTDSTGLGLAICRTIVEAHGGTIYYARTGDDRTAFTVELPVDPEGRLS